LRDDVLDGATLRDGLKAFAKNGRMRIILVEPSVAGRTALSARFGDLGIEVAPFGDPHVAFLFHLGRLDQVDGVLVNGDDVVRTSRLLARLEMLAPPIAVVTYSSRDPGRAAAIAVVGGPATATRGCALLRSEESAG
jgi:hypothetical protein